MYRNPLEPFGFLAKLVSSSNSSFSSTDSASVSSAVRPDGIAFNLMPLLPPDVDPFRLRYRTKMVMPQANRAMPRTPPTIPPTAPADRAPLADVVAAVAFPEEVPRLD